MNLINRFIYFFIGLSLGVLILIFIWDKKGTKDFAYSPNAWVLKDINSKNIHFPANLHTAFAKNIITASEINLILRDGEVDFAKSNTKLDSCKVYHIDGNLRNKKYSIKLENCNKEVKVYEYNIN